MGSSDGAAGFPCSVCQEKPSFNFTGEHLCAKHLPWNVVTEAKSE